MISPCAMARDSTTVKGVWWLEHQPNDRWQGEVTYGPTSGAELDLFGYPHEAFDDASLERRFTLHGLTFKNKPVSLFECLIARSEINLPGERSCRINSASGVVGGHYHSLDEIAFKTAQARLTGLREWVWASGLRVTPATNPQGITASYRVPEAIPLGVCGPLSLWLEASGNVQPDFFSLQIEEDWVLVIEADQMRPYKMFEESIKVFQRFLCLAVQRPVYAMQITVRIDQPKGVVQNTPTLEELVIIRRISLKDWNRQKLISQDLLFTSHELGTSPANAFGRFAERQTKLEASMDLYISTIYNETQLPRVKFLALAQSLEAYHRARFSGKYMTDADYQAGLRKRLWEAVTSDNEPIDSDFRASLSTKLNYLHEFSLKKRLKEIARKHRGILEPLIGDPDTFSKTVSDLRNTLTHPGEDGSGGDDDFRKVWRLSEMMALLLEVCFLDEIGFPEARITQIILNRSRRAYRVHRGWV